MSEAETRAAVEAAARESYGRLLAYLAARSGDVAGAEDALGDAFLSALKRWPEEGVPDRPEAWLLHAARNRLIDASRRSQVRQNALPYLAILTEGAETLEAMNDVFPDERLKLLFVCAHPGIDPAARTPLMLQTVLGVEAERIASAFLVSPAAMSQRLVRAKARIRDEGIPFLVPEAAQWDERVGFVLDAIYAAYSAGWDFSVEEAGTTHRNLANEAVALGRTLARLMQAEPEALGLLSLMLHCEARREARHSASGDFVPLDEQDTGLWSAALAAEAESLLRRAFSFGRPGRFQFEAAIQSLHAARAVTGAIDWPSILQLYEGLLRIAPGIGAEVGRAVALAQTGESLRALSLLDELASERTAAYQPYWASRAHTLRLLGRNAEAANAFERAASLTDDPALKKHLLGRAARCR